MVTIGYPLYQFDFINTTFKLADVNRVFTMLNDAKEVFQPGFSLGKRKISYIPRFPAMNDCIGTLAHMAYRLKTLIRLYFYISHITIVSYRLIRYFHSTIYNGPLFLDQ